MDKGQPSQSKYMYINLEELVPENRLQNTDLES